MPELLSRLLNFESLQPFSVFNGLLSVTTCLWNVAGRLGLKFYFCVIGLQNGFYCLVAMHNLKYTSLCFSFQRREKVLPFCTSCIPSAPPNGPAFLSPEVWNLVAENPWMKTQKMARVSWMATHLVFGPQILGEFFVLGITMQRWEKFAELGEFHLPND